MTNKILKIDNIKFTEIVKTSNSLGECIRKCGIPSSYGSYYDILKNRIQELKLDISHFNGKSNDKSVFNGGKRKYKTEEIFILNGISLTNTHLKSRFIKDFKIECKCKICNISTWNNKPLTLQLDHINGDRNDNRPENLRLICPNCHSQTETYCKSANRKTNYPKTQKQTLCSCGQKKWRKAKICKECENKRRLGQNSKIEWPSDTDLINLLQNNSMLSIANKLGVSFNAVKNHCLRRNIKW